MTQEGFVLEELSTAPNPQVGTSQPLPQPNVGVIVPMVTPEAASAGGITTLTPEQVRQYLELTSMIYGQGATTNPALDRRMEAGGVSGVRPKNLFSSPQARQEYSVHTARTKDTTTFNTGQHVSTPPPPRSVHDRLGPSSTQSQSMTASAHLDHREDAGAADR